MTSTEKFCLKWNDFQNNFSLVFGTLREGHNFSDVTLVCEDGEKFEAHKVILAASSPFFHKIFEYQKHSHPIIYMRKIKSKELSTLLDFLYHGESSVYQDDLETFLNIAEELQLKGLTERDYEIEHELIMQPKGNPDLKKFTAKKSEIKHDNQNVVNSKLYIANTNYEETLAIPSQLFSGDLVQLDQQIQSMMLVGLHGSKTKIFAVCGKEGYPRNIKDHIEANHINDVSLPCTICEKTFRSRATLRMHNAKHNK